MLGSLATTAALLLSVPSYSYAQEESIEETLTLQLSPGEILWIEDSIPEGAQTVGEWGWQEDIKFSGINSHTDGIKNGIHFHSFNVDEEIELGKKSVLKQYVYLDKDNPPKGIMLKLLTSDGEAIDLYWEGEEEVFVDTLEYMKAWYMGPLPEAGKWHKLAVNIRELEVYPVKIVGMSFIVYDGRAYWDRTLIEQG